MTLLLRLEAGAWDNFLARSSQLFLYANKYEYEYFCSSPNAIKINVNV